MKFLRIIVLACTLTFLTMGASCPKQRTAEAVAFNTCRSTYNVAREAYKAVVKLHLTGKLSDEKRKEADDYWNLFRESFQIQMQIDKADWSTVAPAQIQSLTATFIKTIKDL